jgi:hypothetical protein
MLGDVQAVHWVEGNVEVVHVGIPDEIAHARLCVQVGVQDLFPGRKCTEVSKVL